MYILILENVMSERRSNFWMSNEWCLGSASTPLVSDQWSFERVWRNIHQVAIQVITDQHTLQKHTTVFIRHYVKSSNAQCRGRDNRRVGMCSRILLALILASLSSLLRSLHGRWLTHLPKGVRRSECLNHHHHRHHTSPVCQSVRLSGWWARRPYHTHLETLKPLRAGCRVTATPSPPPRHRHHHTHINILLPQGHRG